MDTPFWALTAAYWLHMLATVIWIGGLAALALFVLPAARRTLPATGYAEFLGGLQRRLDPWSWFSLAVLLATGMLQMSANPNYGGFMAFDNRWAVAILMKHILFLGMAALSAYITWGLLPRLRRLSLRMARAEEVEMHTDMADLLKQEGVLIKINLLLGILILALTAVARAA
jgi:uncharacterized membrane protein